MFNGRFSIYQQITRKMIQKNLTKLIGLKKEQFDLFIGSGQIHIQPARLIPALKTGDEMAV